MSTDSDYGYDIAILACGSRHMTFTPYLGNVLDGIVMDADLAKVIYGDCPTGADAFIHDWAMRAAVDTERFCADWDHFGKSAGPRRNREMIARLTSFWDKASPIVVAFWDGRIKGCGTFDVIREAHSRGIEVRVFDSRARVPMTPKLAEIARSIRDGASDE